MVITGTATGDVLAHDRETLEERWNGEGDAEMTSVVSVEPFGDGVAVGERGPGGAVRCYDLDTGELRWQYATARDVGPPQKESRFFLPFVADTATDGDRLYVASRRYERDGERRSFTSAVYAFDRAGDVVWTYETDASPISVDVDDNRLAIAYNRCPGAHGHGLVVLDAEAGTVEYDWDPGTEGQRRVGDVSLVEDGVVVASHGDYRGYRLHEEGSERWRVDLATPMEVDGESLYAYPNHAHATADGVVFVTGNTYSMEGRETASLHPHEHTAFGYTSTGERVWTASVGGFANGLGIAGDTVVVPGAQHFRERDADAHGYCVIGLGTGLITDCGTDGVITAVDRGDNVTVAIEEPVVYHDEGRRYGSYRLLATPTSGSGER
jgi:outer membrane protein assembly factor BamB